MVTMALECVLIASAYLSNGISVVTLRLAQTVIERKHEERARR